MLLFWRKHMTKQKTPYFSKGEKLLWLFSVASILLSFFLFDGKSFLTLAASLVGVTSLIFNAKGNPFGQVLMILFSLLYGVISYSFRYYGEMITYLGMTMPMAAVALVSWLRNPYRGNRAEVTVNRVGKKESLFMWALTGAVTLLFYFVLDFFHTANILPSTLSVTTSFIAVYLTFRRSPYYAVGYAANDVILMVLWGLASAENRAYLSVVVCFAAFLLNDMYGYVSWKKMEKRQWADTAASSISG